ncbi:MlaE family ABC transporter permease [Chondromyces crocatus]|uniref:ABC transporter permease n=1 Tax=Chondromyces crocatus TaxID=52 RepID=A0A0K1EIQ2_CHOCO|nr:ABC transporter permease [Chondromyces crocatus]AKT40473.1 ABC transporter permease [Chondromyces crocatus]
MVRSAPPPPPQHPSPPEPEEDEGRPSIELRDVLPEPHGVAFLGAQAMHLARQGGDLASVFVRTLYYCVQGRRERGAVLQQMYEIGNKSIFFLSLVMAFLGMILVYQAGTQTKRVVPDLTMLGANYLELLVRELAPTIGALMLATRVGAGIAAEIGSMVVTEQVDALRMSAADPIDYLIKPRFIASVLMTTCLIVWSSAVAFVAGMLMAYTTFDVMPRTFMNASLVDAGDLTVGLVKCLAYGAAIPVVAGHSGLSTYGGSEGVGWATTRAVVNSSLAVIILDVIISTAGFLVFR